ncbi:MAG: serine/threonine protein kinase [Symploca sp. SIO1C4]|uniref:Serine/threonine protein kinase n=1 Tax=Symploca sp. SIO1C4 TaxID=2607765 RepID=A0A6B3MZU7_9CYAN|nr:serine/threonine protein kinase [Symploca sp. SIO1C4]
MVWKEGQELQAGKYIIGKVLGQGGFGITYQALHTTLNQQVVIKTPNEYLQHDPDYDKYVKRFIKEARLIAKLSQDPHPHIVRVSDLFNEGETHCLVMEFIPGKSLFELVKQRGALPEAEAINYIRQIGDALAFVHQQGLVHRDAHPGNIMLRGKGKAVLIDFGISGELVPTTVSSMHPGNKGFAPIEQMQGYRQPTVDIYCLAATLYYTVTAERPTTSFDRKAFDAILSPPKQLNPTISDRLNQGILKGMALEAEDRPQSMQEWLKLLEAPTIVIPPPVEKIHRQKAIRPSPKKPSTSRPRKSDARLDIVCDRTLRNLICDRFGLIALSCDV